MTDSSLSQSPAVNEPSRFLRIVLAPVCFAAFVVISMYAHNFTSVPFEDVGAPLILSALAALLIAAPFWLGPWSQERAGLAALAAVILFFTHENLLELCLKFSRICIHAFPYIDPRWVFFFWCAASLGSFLWFWLRPSQGAARVWVLSIALAGISFGLLFFGARRDRFGMAWTVVACLVIAWVLYAPYAVQRVNALMRTVVTILLLMALSRLALVSLTSRGEENSAAAATLESPAAATVPFQGELRDIYFLVFDRYASQEVLKNYLDFDNSEFYRELEKRGFHCLPGARANYPQSTMSMTATLNMRYHGDTIMWERDCIPILQQHRVGKILCSHGYKYNHLGNWFAPLRQNPQAAYNFRISPLPSNFADAVYNATALASAHSIHFRPDIPLTQFQVLEKVAEDPAATFTYAHFLLPHPPYLFDANGGLVDQAAKQGRSESELYLQQLQFTSRRILEAIDRILLQSKSKPIIILAADEGPYLMGRGATMSEVDRIRQRCGILLAFHLPDCDMAATIPPEMSAINIFPVVLNHYHQCNLPLLEDRNFYWDHPGPQGDLGNSSKQLIDVTDRLR